MYFFIDLFVLYFRFMTNPSDVKTSPSAPVDSKMTSSLSDLHRISPKTRGFLIEDILLNKPKSTAANLSRSSPNVPSNNLAYLQRGSFHEYATLAAAFTGGISPAQLQHPLTSHPLFVPKPMEHAHPFLLGGMAGQ